MGWKSTRDVTRQEAEEMLIAAIDSASDADLVEALNAIVGDECLDNFAIVQSPNHFLG